MSISSTSFATSSGKNAVDSFEYTCVSVSLSCDKSGEICGTTTDQIVSQAAFAEEYWCAD